MTEEELEKLVTPKGIIESNFNYETKLALALGNEISDIDEFLEFILENKADSIRYTRNVRTESTSDTKVIPSDFYDCGNEKNIYQESKYGMVEPTSWSTQSSYKNSTQLTWIEWGVLCTDGRDNISMKITPFLFQMTSQVMVRNSISNTDFLENSEVRIFTSEIFKKWNTKLEEIIIDVKKNKVSNIMEKCHTILGIDRKAKIKKLLDK